ncbi:bifunctional [glutamate--ammonia ligase]-adenylyl-L-tyrosine phosphorylase/[glutamate--ammonia-ligase] adenylyltransferase [Thermaurantiacus sp.]
MTMPDPLGNSRTGCGGMDAVTAIAEALARAERHSPFLRMLIRNEDALVGQVRDGDFSGALAKAAARLVHEDAAVALRRARGGVALVVALADLAGAWSLEEVTAALSEFADAAIDRALDAAFAAVGVPSEDRRGITILGLGKLGSRELNYSSDVDLIVLHDPAQLPRMRAEDPDEAAARLVRRMGALLSERTAEGYALRVDLRLRPDPDATPPSLRLAAAEAYYQSQALAFERSAFIRARAVAGDRAMGSAFLTTIAPFVWRRSLDYSALAEIRDITLRIRDHFHERQNFGPGYDVKRGRGGIREVEFFAQVHQMIFGGRDPALRAPATLDALAALAEAGRITRDAQTRLAGAYRALRTLEHRLQMVDDQQTHRIPRLAADRAQVAGLAGAHSWNALARATERHVKTVAKLYDELLNTDKVRQPRARLPDRPDDIRQWAREARIADPEVLVQAAGHWRSGRPRSLRAPESRAAFETLAPSLVRAVGTGRAGRAGLVRLDQFIGALPSGVQFWRLLLAHPPLAALLARLLTATPLLANALAARPELFDVVIDPPPPLARIEMAIEELEAYADAGRADLETLLDRTRRWTAERRFRIGVDILEGRREVLEAAAELSDMAEAAIVVLTKAVAAAFAAQHGRIPGQDLVVLALGRFGGRALTHQSDLDLVLLFSGSHEGRSDGPVPLGASTYFNRLGQRLIGALTAPTASGPLYEVDTRLRPSGAQGLLAVSVDSFVRYQSQDAEIWETLALTRARPVAGPPQAQASVKQAIASLLGSPRPAEAVCRGAIEMRRLMETHKPAQGPFDVKLMKGGLVDLEFVIAARALIAGTRIPTELEAAAARVAPELIPAHRLFMSVLMGLRLILPAKAAAAPDRAAASLLARTCGKSGIQALRHDLGVAKAAVLAAWEETFGQRR